MISNNGIRQPYNWVKNELNMYSRYKELEKDLDGHDNVDPHFIAFSTSSWLVRY